MTKGLTHSWGRPRGGPWWRFIPSSAAMGYVGLLAGFLLMVESMSSLFRGTGNSVFGTTVEVVLAVVSFMLIVQSADGLQILWKRRRGIRRG